MSLTIAEVVRNRFSVALIPATIKATTLGDVQVGQRVNIETDLISQITRRWPHEPAVAIASTVGALGWAGRLTGRAAAEKAVAQLAAGGGVIVWDPDREGEGDVIFSGAALSPAAVTFLLTQACGYVCVPCSGELLDRLEIPAMAGTGDRHGTAFHTPVDLAVGLGTGVSADERAATIRGLARADATAGDFLRPGHVVPVRAADGLLTQRTGHTEAAVTLVTRAGLPPVAAICEIMNPDGTMANGAQVEQFALRWQLPMVTIHDLARHLT